MYVQLFRILVASILSSLFLAGCGSSSGGGNTAPSFSQASYTFFVDEDDVVSGSVSATDANGDDVFYTVSSPGSIGTMQLNADGSFTYTPDADVNGTDQVIVGASDGRATTTVNVIFEIAPVNDAPLLMTTSITAVAGAMTSGVLTIVDVDDDPITITLVQDVVNGALSLDLGTGEFTYMTDPTTQAVDSFTISYTDGVVTPIEATIDISPSYADNAAKSAYYYASDESHLTKTLNALAQVSDEALVDEATPAIAGGYFVGGLEGEGFNQLDGITAVDVKAEGFRDVALILDALDRIDDANDLRVDAVTFYNQYLAEKGLNNVSSTDASFYQLIIRNYRAVDALEEALNLMSSVRLYADAVREDEYNTAYGRFAVAFSNGAGAAVDAYRASPTSANQALAVQAIADYESIARGTGYNTDNDYVEPFKYRTKAFFVTAVAEYYEAIGEVEAAKEALAYALSFYTDVTYDPAYNRPAEDYAANTLDDYDFPLVALALVFASLYPDLDNVAAQLIFDRDPNDSSNGQAQEGIYAVQAANDILAGGLVADAVADGVAYFTAEDDLLGLYRMYVERFSDPSLAFRLYYAGDTDAAVQVLDEARALIVTPEFSVDANFLRYLMGDQGCSRLAAIYMQFTGDAADAVAACQTIVDNYYQNDGSQDTDDLIEARSFLLYSYNLNRANAPIESVVPGLVGDMATFAGSLTDDLDRIEYELWLSAQLASYGLFDEAIDALGLATADIEALLATPALPIDDIEDVVSLLLEYGVGDYGLVKEDLAQYQVFSGVRRQAGTLADADVADATSDVLSAIAAMASAVDTLVSTYTPNEQQGVREDLVSLLLTSGEEAAAEALAADDVINAPADSEALWSTIAGLYAQRDDFPATSVASVDTDLDALPNFFFVNATEDEITASGLTADDDADNDGIVDESDLFPLDPEN